MPISVPQWKAFKRNAKLTPTDVQQIFKMYMDFLHDRGLTTTIEVKMVRPAIVAYICGRFNYLDPQQIRCILRRSAWKDQPVPEDWIPYF